jgi:hypothetical protein
MQWGMPRSQVGPAWRQQQVAEVFLEAAIPFYGHVFNIAMKIYIFLTSLR